ncbi:hypothetical protein [Stenotrophomonas maltophilia]|uniref:hypothetical protein n=1 Tax=Stenotrophomonas maltophilia TaxID=40324 RepID=UPI003BF8BD28
MAKKIMRKILALCLGIVAAASLVSSPVQAQRNTGYQPPPRQYQPPPPRQPQYQPRQNGKLGYRQPSHPGFQQQNTYRPSQAQQSKRDDTISRLKAAQGKGLENTARSGTAGAIRERLQREGKLGAAQLPKAGNPVTAKSATTPTRPLTPGEIQRGFTGKVTTDGKALIKLGNRVVTAPASRVSGLSARLAANNNRLKAVRWTQQQQTNINQKLKALAANEISPQPPGGKIGGSGGGGCQPPESLKCKFNRVANRIEYAGLARSGDTLEAGETWVREPASIQDQMTLAAAKRGEGFRIIPSLSDGKYKGMEKFQLKTKSNEGRDSVVHYVRDPKTGNLMDFKFKKRSID